MKEQYRAYWFNKQKGFTLIELLVVVAIISLLSSISLASLNIARSKARDARRLADVHQIQTAVELYYSDFGIPVGSGAGWWAEVNNTCPGWYPSPYSQLMPTYIKTLPDDPLSPGTPPAVLLQTDTGIIMGEVINGVVMH